MKLITITITLLIFVSCPAFAQAPDTLWTRTFGGTQGDESHSVQQTTDAGYIIAGSTRSIGPGSREIWLIKTSADGNELWSRTFGGPNDDYGYSVQQTMDGGYIVAGGTRSFGAGVRDVWLIRTDAVGNELWSQTFGGADDEYGYSVEQTTDGGYIIAGTTESFGAGMRDIMLIKTDADGDELWFQTFGGTDNEYGYGVQQTIDGGFVVTGSTMSFGEGNGDIWLINVDENANVLWSQTLGGGSWDEGRCVQQTTDGGYIVTGVSFNIGVGHHDAVLVRTDASGNVLWSQTLGGPIDDYGYSVQQTTDGGYIVAGTSSSFNGGILDAWLTKTDSGGNELWTQSLGGSSTDVAHCVQQTIDGGYIVAGLTNSFGSGSHDAWLIRLESEEPRLSITLTPTNPPIEVPASGGMFEFNALLQNPTDYPIVFDAWTEVDLINGNTYGPILLRHNLTLQASGQFDVTLSQNIPGFLLAGVYTFRGCVGTFPEIILDSSEFTFEKLPPGIAVAAAIEDWQVRIR